MLLNPGTDGATAYMLGATDLVTITVTGDFTGASQFAIDLDGSGTITSSADTAANEVFTINSTLTRATITVNCSRLGGDIALFLRKTANVVLQAPRTFSISATIAPAAGGVTSRTIGSNSTWWTWKSNGTIMTALSERGDTNGYKLAKKAFDPCRSTRDVERDCVDLHLCRYLGVE